jgi:hypothetical protein
MSCVYVGQRGMHRQAFEMYTIAASLGLFIAELNKANVLELQGFTAEAVASFEDTLVKAEAEVTSTLPPAMLYCAWSMQACLISHIITRPSFSFATTYTSIVVSTY